MDVAEKVREGLAGMRGTSALEALAGAVLFALGLLALAFGFVVAGVILILLGITVIVF